MKTEGKRRKGKERTSKTHSSRDRKEEEQKRSCLEASDSRLGRQAGRNLVPKKEILIPAQRRMNVSQSGLKY